MGPQLLMSVLGKCKWEIPVYTLFGDTRGEMMLSSFEWLVPLFTGLLFSFLGVLKLYGLCKGYEGGPRKTIWEKLRAGSCAEEHCRLPKRLRLPLFLLLSLLFLGFGLYCLSEFFISAFS